MAPSARQISCIGPTVSAHGWVTSKLCAAPCGARKRLTVIACSQDRGTGSSSFKVLKGCKTEEQGRAQQYERLFSNLNEATLMHEPGNVTSAILLIAGTTIGAGILAIPAVTQEAGFVASSTTCVLCWLYMVATGLLVAEVNVKTMCELGSGGVSIVSMARRTLGQTGVGLSSVAYLLIHYTLLVAYVARASDIISNTIGTPLPLSALIFSALSGGLCYLGSQRLIGNVNGALVVSIVATFAALVVNSSGNIELDSLLRANFAAAPRSVPVIALAFVYQNVVPVICTNLEGDLSKIRSSILAGTSIPLVMFIIWDAVILGNLSDSGSGQSLPDPLMQLRSASGFISPLVETFSMLAITTSYIGFVLGLSDFLADLLKLPSGGSRQLLPYALTVIPPAALALLSPGIFFQALDFAGAYGVLVLFGILPASMAWSQRYSLPGKSVVPVMLPGGRLVLCLIIGGAGFIIATELAM